ncbi:hypothetical protein MTO96_033189 [Rhipicephalus appendiculatus]
MTASKSSLTPRTTPPTDAVLPDSVAAPQGGDFADFGLCFEVHKSVTLRTVPSRSRSWVSLAKLDSIYAVNATKHEQLTVFIGDFQQETMKRLNEWWRGNKFRRIRYLAIVPASGVAASFQCNTRNQSSLCNFLRSCVALVELNLSAFHFGADFNWSSMLATGGLDHVRSLSLAACALCKPGHLQLLGRASFKLRELDVRFFPQEAPNCNVCLLTTTSDDDALAPLRCLNSLERLTLCELYAAKFECAKSFNNFNAFFGMPAAPMMKRLCLTGHSTDGVEVVDLIDLNSLFAMQKACPALDIVHVHAHYPEKGVQHRFFTRHPFLLADNVPDLERPPLAAHCRQSSAVRLLKLHRLDRASRREVRLF